MWLKLHKNTVQLLMMQMSINAHRKTHRLNKTCKAQHLQELMTCLMLVAYC